MQAARLPATLLEIDCEVAESHVFVRVRGECDITNAHRLAEVLRDAAERSRHPVIVLDLHELGYLDSSGISAMLETWRIVQGRSGLLVVVDCQPPVQRIIEVIGLHQLLPVVCSVNDALTIAREHARAARG